MSSEIKEINWSESHPGLYRTPVREVVALMPELIDIMLTLPNDVQQSPNWTVDVKVHMLMPGQWPCIPNWHYDNVARNNENIQQFSDRVEGASMWLWLSGPPLTEFRQSVNGEIIRYQVPAQTWHKFNQWDEHRGTMSEAHQWRCFIRLSPFSILKPAPEKMWLRRHSQVYLDAGRFKW